MEITDKPLKNHGLCSSFSNISIHPLVIMNISEHWTRIRAQNPALASAGVCFFSASLFRCKAYGD